jgi:hypothetical protein
MGVPTGRRAVDIGEPRRVIIVEPASEPAVEPVPAEPDEQPTPAAPSDR